jgi:hypothetical protein
MSTISADELRELVRELQPGEVGDAEQFGISPAIGKKYVSSVLAVWWD